MIAGAGANLKQQFGIPNWIGALLCAVMIVIVAFLDFEKITSILGDFHSDSVCIDIVNNNLYICRKEL